MVVWWLSLLKFDEADLIYKMTTSTMSIVVKQRAQTKKEGMTECKCVCVFEDCAHIYWLDDA